ncbi:potassium-transporting ATPase subunit C, partial [Streptomyces longwoodensis]|uniref:potassium-transporting ATPase subunit C n=1 Tax=Streptomyces longwoodensis TaxID=68231 RepID=UPI00340BADAB
MRERRRPPGGEHRQPPLAGARALLVLTLVTGVLYPLAVTGVAQALFPGRANG